MFQSLTEKFTAVIDRLHSKGRLTQDDIDESLRQIRLALLGADVHFQVARDLVDTIRNRSIGHQMPKGISPGQQIVKIVHEELVQLLSSGNHSIRPNPVSPSPIMLVGLQGSGKTTTAGKLALHLQRKGQLALLTATDLRRPAAVEQLTVIGRQINVPVYSESPTQSTAVNVAQASQKHASRIGALWTIIDTGGRLQIDTALMEELVAMKTTVDPAEVLLVVDAMIGQEAIHVADAFHRQLGLTGIILSKVDGDARGGAVLAIAHTTGVPVKYVGVGEKNDALEPFHPERIASRILGMGDVLTLAERAQEGIDIEQAKALNRKIRKSQFDLDDFLDQLQHLQRMGPLTSIVDMLPGFGRAKQKLSGSDLDDNQTKRMAAVISSMTPWERRHPDRISGSRRRRIALGSGTSPQAVNQLLGRFREVQKMLHQIASGREPGFSQTHLQGLR